MQHCVFYISVVFLYKGWLLYHVITVKRDLIVSQILCMFCTSCNLSLMICQWCAMNPGIFAMQLIDPLTGNDVAHV